MMYRVKTGRRLGRLGIRVALAALAALPGIDWNAQAHATDGSCPDCASADEARRTRLDALLEDDPTRDRLDGRLGDKPWIGQDWATLPVAVKPAEESLDLTTSLQHLGSYQSRRTSQKIEDAKALAPKGLAIPKPIQSPPAALDVWSRVHVKGFEGDTTETKRGTIGADYKLARGALVGMSAEIVDEGRVLQQDTRLAAYFAIKPWSPVTLDGKAQWGESHGLQGGGLVTTQSAVTARVKGSFNYEGLVLTPMASVAHGVDEAPATGGGRAIEKSTLALTPKVSRPVEIGGGVKVEPFLSLKSALDISPASEAAAHGSTDTTRSVGGGVTLARPDAYSLSVTTDLEQSTGSDHTNVKGRFELKLPLR
jgi:hypothetical protein